MASILKTISQQLAAISVCALATTLPAVAAPKVVASIAPIHSIAAAIMKNVGEPHLLVPPSASPHSTDLRPSGARALQDADLVFWVGPRLEAFLVKPIESLANSGKSVPLVEAKDIELLPLRSGANWEKHAHGHDGDDHGHGDHEHDEHDDHGHEGHKHDDHDHKAEKHDDHGHEGHKHDDHDHKAEKHDDHEGHGHDDHAAESDHKLMDSHIWLSPHNGIAMATAMTAALSEADPENAKIYAANFDAFKAELKAAVNEANSLLEEHKTTPFIVFHDAYQYFEHEFELSAAGSIMLQPGVNPGAARVKEVREKLKSLKAACLLSEPQFSNKLIPILVEGTTTSLGEFDPIGSSLKEGPSLYPDLIRLNARQLADCLK